jgi:hypothetical protein
VYTSPSRRFWAKFAFAQLKQPFGQDGEWSGCA